MHNLYFEDPDHQGLETQEIEEWTPEEVSDFIDIWAEDRKKAKRTRVLCRDKDAWVAVDNSTSDCWVEDFVSKKDAIDWLNGKEIAPGEECLARPTWQDGKIRPCHRDCSIRWGAAGRREND